MALRPWEMVASNARPWEEGGLGNRTVTINRPNPTAPAIGLQPVVEYTPSQFTLIASGIPCCIEMKRQSGSPLGQQPGDSWHRIAWSIFIDAGDAAVYQLEAAGLIRERDVLTDDAGFRYQVEAAYWHALYGWNLLCEKLQA